METITTIELSRLSELEATIEKGLHTFVDVGKALAEIHRDRLYRDKFGTFEDYCRQKWRISRIQAFRLMSGSEAVTEMEMLPIGNKELPAVANEGQARELAKIKDPEQRAEVWKQVNEVAKDVNKAVTAKLIQKAVEVHQVAEVAVQAPAVVEESVKARQQHVEHVKNSPATRWTNFLYDIRVNLNSIRDNGGISRLAAQWSIHQKDGYLRELRELRDSIQKVAEQLEGAIDHDLN